MIDSGKKTYSVRLKEKVDIKNGLLEKFKGLAEEESDIRSSELSIATLYEVTKRMSAMLRLSNCSAMKLLAEKVPPRRMMMFAFDSMISTIVSRTAGHNSIPPT